MIVGPNGAGKTTLLKLLDGEVLPTEGTVTFDMCPVCEWDKKLIAQRRAVLPQHSMLDFPFIVRDVIELGRLPHQSDSSINNEIVNKVAELSDCSDFLDRPFPFLSGGEQQRVQIARALAQIWDTQAQQDHFLILDEPLSALDLSHQYALLKILKNLANQKNTGVICVLHNLNLAAQFADRCLILDQGRLVADGEPAEVFTPETLSNVFNLDILIQPHPQNETIPLIIPNIETA
jgi:iron complex transport system ATP-binding protein